MSLSEFRVCVYGADGDAVEAIQQVLDGLRPIEVIVATTDPQQLAAGLDKPRIRALLVVLDPSPDDTLELIQLVVPELPDLAVIGLSRQQDPQQIVSAIQAGCNQFISLPASSDDLIAVFEKLGVPVVPADAKGQRIAVIGPTGGSGATTVACNLALEMARLSHCEVALADLHAGFGDVVQHFAVHPSRTIAELCVPDRTVEERTIRQVATLLPCNVAVIPAPTDLAHPLQYDPECLRHALEVLSQVYRAVVIDTPRQPTGASWTVIENAHSVLLVMQLTAGSLYHAQRLCEFLSEHGIPNGRVQLVVNRFREDFGSIRLQDVEERFGREVFATIPSDYELVRSSADVSHPLLADAPNNPVRMAICNIARRLLGLREGEAAPAVREEPSQRRSRLLGRLLGKQQPTDS
ncbi:MAG TPA: AAA family ATPase [Phycisphaerae bacterium]|nr:AAA family ATPase [Phycisphaerae bacterium]